MKLKKIIASVFLIFHFLVMLRIFMPLNTTFFSKVYQPIDSYLSFFSIYQDWMMFAPNPSRYESKYYADIEFEDGSTTTYEFGSEERNFWTKKLYKEKMRKIFEGEVTQNKEMLTDLARFSLRQIRNTHFHRIPLKVVIRKKIFFTQDMEKIFISYHDLKNASSEETIFTYEVI